MIYSLSDKVVDYLEVNNYLKEDKDIYMHGARLVISSIIGTSFVFLIGIITNHFIEAILYEIIMSSSRKIMGGYHCKSYASCIGLYIFIFSLGISCLNHLFISFHLLLVIKVIGIVITFVLCPVRHVHKEVSELKRLRFKVYSVMYVIIYTFILNILYFFNLPYFHMFLYIFISIQFLTIGGRIEYGKAKA